MLNPKNPKKTSLMWTLTKALDLYLQDFMHWSTAAWLPDWIVAWMSTCTQDMCQWVQSYMLSWTGMCFILASYIHMHIKPYFEQNLFFFVVFFGRLSEFSHSDVHGFSKTTTHFLFYLGNNLPIFFKVPNSPKGSKWLRYSMKLSCTTYTKI